MQVVESTLYRVLQSLWRAAYMTGDMVRVMQAHGYDVTAIGSTQIGGKPLSELIRDQKGQLTHITQIR